MHCPSWDDAFVTGSVPRSGKLPVLNLLTARPKNRFSPRRGDSLAVLAPIHVKRGRADGHVGPLGCRKFHLNRHRGVGMRLQNIKNFHFLVNSRPVGASPLTDFEIF